MKKKTSKLAFTLGLFSLILSGCGSPTPSEFEKQTREIYESGLRDGSIKDQTYEQWLESIRGQDGKDGQDGHSPSIRIGDNGNWFIDDVDTGVSATGPAGKDGLDGTDGKDGVDGTDGKDGVDGKDGQDGKDGVDGQDGKDGSSVLTGHGAPLSSLGNDGDSYIDLDTWTLYTKLNSSWELQGSFKGQDGQDGKDGTDGADGKDGIDGQDGADGKDGADGISIVNTYIDENGDLIVEFSNGENKNVGHIKDVNTFTVKFWVDDDLVATRNVISGAKVSRPTKEETAGYAITDWYFLDGSIHESWKFFGYVVTEDINLYAEYTCNEYTVRFVDNTYGYTIDDTVVTYDNNYAFTQLEKVGYTHVNFVDIDSNVFEISGVWRTAKNITLYVQWAANSYTIDLNPNGGQVVENSLVVYYDSIYELPVPTRTNYVFLGWFDDDVKVSSKATWKYISNKTLTARWTNVTNTYVLDPGNGHCDLDSIIIGWEDEYILPTPTYDGYYFCGWYLDDVYVENQGIWTYSNVGAILTAKWVDSRMVYPNTLDGIIFFPRSFKVVPEKACQNNESLTTVILEEGIEEIGPNAFSNCYSLVNTEFPSTIQRIGASAFSSCQSLRNISLPDTIYSIGGYAFSYCHNLTSIDLPHNELYSGILGGTFSGCTSLETIVLPDTIKVIAKNVFSDCEQLKTIVMSENLVGIFDEAFSNCFSLASIIIPISVVDLDKYIFSGCSIIIYCETKSKPFGWDPYWSSGIKSGSKIVWGYKGGE